MKLSLEPLEDRSTPAMYRVMIVDPAAPKGDTAAQHFGTLRLSNNFQVYTDTNVNNAPAGSLTMHSVNAADPVSAIQQAVAGDITVTLGNLPPQLHPFTPATSSGVEGDHKTFWIASAFPPIIQLPVKEYQIRMEDAEGLVTPDWDYNDHMWTVRVYDEAADEVLPNVGLVDGSGNALAHPRVAKWENAFEYERDGSGAKIADPNTGGFKTQLVRTEIPGPPGQPAQKVEWDRFIEDDPDKFRIQVTDPKENTNPAAADFFEVTLFTFGEGDYRRVLLTETGANTGVFRSRSLLLVSNAQDDEYAVKDDDHPNNGVADNDPRDRTFLVKSARSSISSVPGRFQMDRLWINYDYRRSNDPATANRNVKYTTDVLGGTATKTGIVKLHVTILKDASGTAVITEDAVKDMIRTANEVYASVGIHFQLSGVITQITQPNGVKMEADPPNGDPGGIALGDYPMTIPAANEAGKVANSNRTNNDPDDIEVYFVNSMYLPDGAAPCGVAAPGSIVPKDGGGAPDGRYRDTVLLAAKGYAGVDGTKATPYTLAHELGHVLTDDTHFLASGVWEVNLMRAGVQNQVDIYDSKRLTAAQQTTLYSAWPNLVNRAYADADEV